MPTLSQAEPSPAKPMPTQDKPMTSCEGSSDGDPPAKHPPAGQPTDSDVEVSHDDSSDDGMSADHAPAGQPTDSDVEASCDDRLPADQPTDSDVEASRDDRGRIGKFTPDHPTEADQPCPTTYGDVPGWLIAAATEVGVSTDDLCVLPADTSGSPPSEQLTSQTNGHRHRRAAGRGSRERRTERRRTLYNDC